MTTTVLDTSFEGTNGATTFTMAVGTADPGNNRTISNTYAHTGTKSYRYQASEYSYLNFASAISASFDVTFWIFIPSGAAWGSIAGLFRIGGSSSNPGIEVDVGASTADVRDLASGTVLGTISKGTEHKLRCLCDGTTWTLYIDDVAQLPYTLSSSYSGGDTIIEMAHSGSDYYFGDSLYIDDLVVVSDPAPPGPPPAPPDFWTGFVSCHETI